MARASSKTSYAWGLVLALATGAPAAPGSPTPNPPNVHPKRFEAPRSSERTDQPGEAQAFFLSKRRLDGRPLDLARYQTALAQMQTMPRYVSGLGRFLPSRAAESATTIDLAAQAAVTSLWAPLGPGNIGGRIRRLVIHPTRPATMWAAAVDGGVWKTINGGASWAPTGDFLPNLAFSSLALTPSNPAILYAGSGEGFFNGDGVRGAGVFKTIDGGAHWTQLATTRNLNFFYVNDVAVSKGNGSRVYAATRTGVWRSLDAGATWTQVLKPNVTGGCTDLTLRTDQTSDVLFAACGTFAPAAIWRNKKAEGAGGWLKVKAEANMGRTSLAIAPSNQNVVYALAASIQPGQFEDGLLAVFRSDNGGDSWTTRVRNTSSDHNSRLLLSNPVYASLVECDFGTEDQFFNQGWYDNVIAVDPKDPNRVFAGGVDVFVSTDGGATFDPISFWWAGDPPAPPSFAHADQHDIVFAPGYNGTTNKTMFLANDGGVWRIPNARSSPSPTVCDPGRSAFAFVKLNHGLEATQFYDGAAYPGGARYFGGTQDNGTTRGSNALGRNGWTEILGGDGGYVAVDPAHPGVLYAENTGLSIQKSEDGGASFNDATAGLDDDGALFIAPFEMDPSDGLRLWTGGNRIWRTVDGAGTWTPASAALPGSAANSVSSIGIAPSRPDSVLVGSSAGDILSNAGALSADGDSIWPSTKPRVGFVSSLAFDPNDPLVAYATYATFGGVHVWKTIDGGAVWTPRDGSGNGKLPDLPAHSLAVDPANPSHLFLGTDLGVFVSVDGGETWAIEATGFPNVVTEAIQIQGDALFAFTHGRGAWRTSITH